jgi:2-haloacid dehalogenase
MVVAFDVNETLLDLRALDPLFERGLGSAALRGPWFAQMLQLALVGGLTGRYVDFTAAQRAALAMLAEREGIAVAEADAEAIVDGMRRLPPHDDAAEALAALTNSPLDVAEEQLAGAGLRERFEAVLSADEVRALKPAPAPYRLVAERLGVPIGDVRLVAAHAWDVAGALAAGCTAAFVARPGMVLSPLGERPDVIGSDLLEVAEQILRKA